MRLENRIERLEQGLVASTKHEHIHLLDQNEDRVTYTVRTSPSIPERTILTAKELDQLSGLKVVVVRSEGM